MYHNLVPSLLFALICWYSLVKFSYIFFSFCHSQKWILHNSYDKFIIILYLNMIKYSITISKFCLLVGMVVYFFNITIIILLYKTLYNKKNIVKNNFYVLLCMGLYVCDTDFEDLCKTTLLWVKCISIIFFIYLLNLN